jgi:endonuclease I
MKNIRARLALLAAGILLVGCGTAPSANLSLTKHSVGISARSTDAYYQLAQGKTRQALLTALHDIIDDQKDLGYNGARTAMFSTVDDPSNKDSIECVYTGRVITGVNTTEAASGKQMNTEHSWPQSLGATGPAKADLHHLFPTDINTNGARSSYPFGEVANNAQVFPQFDVSEGQSSLGVDSQGRTVFEPRNAHKGDLARALFYFYTRYALDSKAKVDLKNFRVEREVLLKWNQLDPVDDAERTRNEAIYKIQGNRNPFVDHPEYAAAI